MKALLTGGNGFIGSHLIDALRDRGMDLVVIDRGDPRTDMDWAGVTYYKGDFTDERLLDHALRGCSVVYHLASTTVPGTANLDPPADVKGNLLGTMALLESMRKAECGRILFLSSGGTVYGDCKDELVAEDAPCLPISSYGIVKFAIERFLLMYQRTSGLQPVILRASNPYGIRQGKTGLQGLVGTAISRIGAGQPVDVWGDGLAVRDYIYITDLVDLMVRAGESRLTGVYNAGSGQGASVLDIVHKVAAAFGREAHINFCPGRAFDVRKIVLDINRARIAFDWAPSIPLAAGIEETVENWKEFQ